MFKETSQTNQKLDELIKKAEHLYHCYSKDIERLSVAEILLNQTFLLLNDDFIQEDVRKAKFKKLEFEIGKFLNK